MSKEWEIEMEEGEGGKELATMPESKTKNRWT